MLKSKVILFCCLLSLLGASCFAQSKTENLPQIIFDTDMGGDIDDLGALYALHTYADQNLCTIAAVMSSWSMEHHVAGIDAVNTYFGRPDIPIGAHEGTPFAKEEYTWFLGKEYESTVSHATAMKTTPLYRKLLATAKDTSITVVVTGRLNNIYALLQSAPDDYSNLNGMNLVSQKVARFYIMGGNYLDPTRNEANFKHGGPGVTQYVVENCTRPMIFNGGKIGEAKFGYGTGTRINEWHDDHILKAGYGYFFKNPPEWTGLSSAEEIAPWSIWDIITVQVAVTGTQDYFDVVTEGSNMVMEDGTNRWVSDPDKDHRYLRPKMDPKTYADGVIEPLLMTDALHQRE